MNRYLNNGFMFLFKAVLLIVCARWVIYHFGLNEIAWALFNNFRNYL